MFSPAFQRISHFCLVTSSIVYPSYAGAMAAHVVQDRLHDMWQNAQLFRHRGCSCAAKIMHGPMGRRLSAGVYLLPRCKNTSIKRCLRFGPAGEPSMLIALSARAVAKNVVAISPPGREQDQGSGYERHYVLTMVFGPSARYDPLLGYGIQFRQLHPTDFITPLSGENQQA